MMANPNLARARLAHIDLHELHLLRAASLFDDDGFAHVLSLF